MAEASERARYLAEAEAKLARGRLDPGATAGEYTITDIIAQGGGGTVYGAFHRTTGRAAAVKVLHPSLTVLPKMVERFRREVQVLNLLRHPGIVEVWEVGTLPDGRPFFAMERLPGKTVSALLDGGRMLPREAIEIFELVCGALAAAHSAGVIHRDVKASNILVVGSDPRRIKLLDFGVAKLCGPAFTPASSLTSEGHPVGTPGCMAPEQILGLTVDTRVDIYALGVLLYRMLTGRPPFLAHSALAQMRQHIEQPAPRPSFRAPAAAFLDPIVLRCMEKNPDLRYGSVRELLSALRATVSGAALSDDRSRAAPEIAAAVYVELRVAPTVADTDIGAAELSGSLLDLSEDALREADLLIAFTTGNQVLGVQPLSPDPAISARELARVVGVATALRERLGERGRGDGRVHVNVCVHVGEVHLAASSSAEVLGGPLVRSHAWAPAGSLDRVGATSAVLQRLDGGALAGGPDRLVTAI
jgi:serine/threonine-protein kinase